MTGYYGEAPVDLGPVNLGGWHEFMHYLYLPIRIPERDLCSLPKGVRVAHGDWCRLPERLWFLTTIVGDVIDDAREQGIADPYVYVTARRGFATPGNPLNRPGWHCDDFGGTDLNYIWSDRWPTRILSSTVPLRIREEDQQSMQDMTFYADHTLGMDRFGARQGRNVNVVDAPVGHLLRLTPYVIHDTPLIPEPGGMRSFFKISVSTHRYNLLGNSHNHLLDYDWKMYDRAVVRNQPGGNGDYVEERS